MAKEERSKFNWHYIFNLDSLIVFLVSLVLGILIFVLYCLIKSSFSLINCLDGMFVASAVILFLGFGQLILNQGTFDGIVVGFANLASVFKKNGSKRYDGIYEYQELKKEKRKGTRFRFIPTLTVGVILLIIAFILLAIFNNSVVNAA